MVIIFQEQCVENEVLVQELETLKAQAMDDSVKKSEERIEELTQKVEDEETGVYIVPFNLKLYPTPI